MITTLVTDVDGVFTDGSFLYSAEGKTYKTFGPHDSDGINLIREMGITVVAVTSDHRGFSITQRRMSDIDVICYLITEKERLS